jgi:hypothetical protein
MNQDRIHRWHSILENGNDRKEKDVTDSLNRLYRLFQDEYVQNQKEGQVSVVSRSHIVCNGSRNVKMVTLPDLYLLDTDDIKEIRTFATLLPDGATFCIIHYPNSYDVFSITWKDGNLDIT